MLATSRTLFFTFVFAFTLLIAFAPHQADASAIVQDAAVLHRRQANRMIRKRQDGLLGIIGAGEDPNSTSPTVGSATATDTNSATATGTTDTRTTGTATGTATTGTTTGTGSTTSETTTASASTTTSSTTSSSSSTESTSSSSSTESTSSSQTTSATTPTPTPDAQTSSSQSTLTTTHTTNQEQVSATESASAKGASSSVSRTTITVIGVIAGCIAAVAIIWTIIRKWKFRPSAGFEDRMQPIDWSPEATHGPSGGLNRTVSNASSFHSGSEHNDGLAGPRTYNPRVNGGLVPDLNHDFTAGPTQLGGGYADLQRGPSPGPQMTSVNRGPSFNRGYGY